MFAVFDCLQGPLGFVTEVFLLLREAQNIPALSGEPYLPLAPSPQRQRHRSVCCEPPGGRTARFAAGAQPRIGFSAAVVSPVCFRLTGAAALGRQPRSVRCQRRT